MTSTEVAVIELLVKPGDSIKAEQSLITVESDKASMEIPSSHAGVVKEILKVKLGDKVSEGSSCWCWKPKAPLRRRVTRRCAGCSASPSAPRRLLHRSLPAASFGGHGRHRECDVLVLGAGPGGYSAAFRAADLGLKVVIVERYATWAGLPQRRLHPVQGAAARRGCDGRGLAPGRPRRRFRRPAASTSTKLRGYKEKVIGKLTGGLAGMAKMRKVTVVRGYGPSSAPTMSRSGDQRHGPGQDRQRRFVAFKRCIIAAAARRCACPSCRRTRAWSTRPARWRWNRVPKKMLIVGGGIIGLEMGTVCSTLGARLDVVEMMDGLMQGADRDLVKVWQKMNATASTTSCMLRRPRRWRAKRPPKASRCSSGPGRHQERRRLRPGAAGRGPHAQRQEDRAPRRPAWR